MLVDLFILVPYLHRQKSIQDKRRQQLCLRYLDGDLYLGSVYINKHVHRCLPRACTRRHACLYILVYTHADTSVHVCACGRFRGEHVHGMKVLVYARQHSDWALTSSVPRSTEANAGECFPTVAKRYGLIPPSPTLQQFLIKAHAP